MRLSEVPELRLGQIGDTWKIGHGAGMITRAHGAIRTRTPKRSGGRYAGFFLDTFFRAFARRRARMGLSPRTMGAVMRKSRVPWLSGSL